MKKSFLFILLIAMLALSCQKKFDLQNIVSKSKTIIAKPSETLEFSGYTWNVRNTAGKQGPGPNKFSSHSVWLDSNGYLHLKINFDSASGKWLCAEVSTTDSFLYGIYKFEVEGAIDKFDKNIVLGLFNYSGNDGFDEMDIEFARWGNITYPNMNYTIWPAEKGFHNFSYTKEFSLGNIYSTHQFVRDSNMVIFKSYKGFTDPAKNLISKTTCKSPGHSISKRWMPVYINLWLFRGHAPTDKKNVEVIIRSFSFTPSS